MASELVPRGQWERGAAELAERYSGFTNAADLSPDEQLASLVSLIPMAMQVVEEARDTIERLNDENAALRGERDSAGIEDAEVA